MPFVVFGICAILAAVGAYLLVFSGGRTENTTGLFALVIFGLASVVLPIVLALGRKNEQK